VGTNPAFRFYEVKVILSGVLWALALVDGGSFEAELAQVKAAWLRELEHVRS
jgi:hypothetical protein